MRSRDIGVWYNILISISRFAVITNALVIAFTSNFIERIFYALTQVRKYGRFKKKLHTDTHICIRSHAHTDTERNTKTHTYTHTHSLTHTHTYTRTLIYIYIYI